LQLFGYSLSKISYFWGYFGIIFGVLVAIPSTRNFCHWYTYQQTLNIGFSGLSIGSLVNIQILSRLCFFLLIKLAIFAIWRIYFIILLKIACFGFLIVLIASFCQLFKCHRFYPIFLKQFGHFCVSFNSECYISKTSAMFGKLVCKGNISVFF